MKQIVIRYTNWLDDEVELSLKPISEVASFTEMLKLKEKEKEGKDRWVFEKTLEFFKRSFGETENDAVEAEYFLTHNMETVTTVLQEWLEKSYEYRQQEAYEKLLGEVMSVKETFDNELEEEDWGTTFQLPSNRALLTNLIFFGLLSVAIVVSILFSYTWVWWVLFGLTSFFSLFFAGALLISFRAKKQLH